MKVCYAIIRNHGSCGGGTATENQVSLVMEDTGFQYLSFATREEAKAWIRRLLGRTDRESRPATYLVAEVGSESFREAYKRTRGVEWSALTSL
jgi:hypothetical protein